MKVLFYGVCHARALQKIFLRFARSGQHEFGLVFVSEIIAAGKPFPYDYLKTFDAIVFSPVYISPGYETAPIIEFCSKHNIICIGYPFLEWHGYYPGAFLGRTFYGDPYDLWYYPGLVNRAVMTKSFDAYFKSIIDDDRINQAVIGQTCENFQKSINLLQRAEQKPHIDFPISPYILENYKHIRLFLSPVHPSIQLVQYVALEISARLELPLAPEFKYTAADPLFGYKVPILPVVYEALGLGFRDSDFFHYGNFSERTEIDAVTAMSLRNYLEYVYYHAQQYTILKSSQKTYIKLLTGSWNPQNAAATLVDSGEMLIGQIEAEAGDFLLINAMLPMHPAFRDGFQSLYIHKPDWIVWNEGKNGVTDDSCANLKVG